MREPLVRNQHTCEEGQCASPSCGISTLVKKAPINMTNISTAPSQPPGRRLPEDRKPMKKATCGEMNKTTFGSCIEEGAGILLSEDKT